MKYSVARGRLRMLDNKGFLRRNFTFVQSPAAFERRKQFKSYSTAVCISGLNIYCRFNQMFEPFYKKIAVYGSFFSFHEMKNGFSETIYYRW